MNYEKLKQNHILDVIENYYKTRKIEIMPGSTGTDIILIGDKPIMFTVEDRTIRYFRGLDDLTAFEIQKLSRVIDKLQSCITLEC